MTKACPHCKKEFAVNIERMTAPNPADPLAKFVDLAYDAIACPDCMSWYEVRVKAKERFRCDDCGPHGALWLNCEYMDPSATACGMAVDKALSRCFVGPKFSKYSNPPAGLLEKNPEHWEWMEKEWPSSGGIHVICTGARGTGKSSCMRRTLYWEIQKARVVMDLSAAFVQNELCAFGPEAAGLRKLAKTVDILLLDDFDRVELTPAAMTVLRDVIDYRHEAERTMFVTCNLSKPELMEFVAGRCRPGDVHGAASLLERFNPNHTMEFTGSSWRPEMSKQNRG